MSLNNKITKNNLVLSTIIAALLFIVLIKVNFWRQLYSLISNNHHTRMIKTFGMCNNDSYGFLKYIEQNYELTEKIVIKPNRIVNRLIFVFIIFVLRLIFFMHTHSLHPNKSLC